jgi:hypothetical protein
VARGAWKRAGSFYDGHGRFCGASRERGIVRLHGLDAAKAAAHQCERGVELRETCVHAVQSLVIHRDTEPDQSRHVRGVRRIEADRPLRRLAADAVKLAKGDKALVGNKGFRRYLRTISEEHFAIDLDKIEEEKQLDGIFVLRTNTDLNPLEAMLCYKQLWTIEQTFRTAKHLFSTRPIFHKLDETIRGHVFCSFLALVLKTELEERIALGRAGSWPEIIADLDSLAETEIEHDGKRFIVRSAPRPAASLALRAAGVALPPTVRDAPAS